MECIVEQTIHFIIEQDGETEQVFKAAITAFLTKCKKPIRAYLVQVKYDESDRSFNVALCLRLESGDEKDILKSSIKIFKSMFSSKEHLDVIFIDQKQEYKLRKICCPFFTSQNYKFDMPDFFLASNESKMLASVRTCYKKRRLYGDHPDGYLLCDIEPSLSVELLGEESKFTEIIFASRHEGYSLFPIKEWPAYVHVAIPLVDLKNKDFIKMSDMKSLAWAELYEKREDIKL